MAARARQPRKEPAQEAVLRQKDDANEKASLLIQLILNAKRGWNGREVSWLNIPASRITEELPDAVLSAIQRIDQLADEVVNRVTELKRSQDQYAASRMRPVERQAALLQLQKEASWVGSRMWAYLTHPFKLDEKDRWKRLRMLRSAAGLYRLLKEIDGHVLGYGNDDIPLAVQKVMRFADVLSVSLSQPISTNVDPELAELEKKLDEAKAKVKREEKERPLASYIGRYVRKTFKTDEGEEDVWVAVTKIRGDKLVGQVAEDAKLVNLNKGDEIELTPEEISKEWSRAVPRERKPGEKAEKELTVVEMRDELNDRSERLRAAYDILKEPGPVVDYRRELVVNEIRSRISTQFDNAHLKFSNAFKQGEKGERKGEIGVIYNEAKRMFNDIAKEILNTAKLYGDEAESIRVAGALAGKRVSEEKLPPVEPIELETAEPTPEAPPEPELTPEEQERARRRREIDIRLGKIPPEEEESGDVDDAIDKLATSILGRWLGRVRTHVAGGVTKELRLNADKQVRQTAKALDRLMEALEKPNVPGNELIDAVQGVSRQSSLMLETISKLALEQHREYVEGRAKQKKGLVDISQRAFRDLSLATKRTMEFVNKIDLYRQRARELAEAERKLRG